MAESARTLPFCKKHPTPQDEERDELLEGLARTRTLIAQAYYGVISARGPALIQA